MIFKILHHLFLELPHSQSWVSVQPGALANFNSLIVSLNHPVAHFCVSSCAGSWMQDKKVKIFQIKKTKQIRYWYYIICFWLCPQYAAVRCFFTPASPKRGHACSYLLQIIHWLQISTSSNSTSKKVNCSLNFIVTQLKESCSFDRKSSSRNIWGNLSRQLLTFMGL